MKASRPKILTVIVAAYAAAPFIKESLESICNQKLPRGWELEVIVAIDGCKSTRKALEAINHPVLKKYWMVKNVGTYVTFNTMMEHAKGDLICRFDADDIMYDDMLRKGLLAIKGHDLVRFSFHFEKRNMKVMPASGVVLFRRSLWEANGGYQPWICSADTHFVNEAERRGSVFIIAEPLFFYRDNPSSLTNEAKTNFKSLVRKNYRNQIQKNWLYPPVKTIGLISEATEI